MTGYLCTLKCHVYKIVGFGELRLSLVLEELRSVVDFCRQSPQCRMKRLLVMVLTEVGRCGKVKIPRSHLVWSKTDSSTGLSGLFSCGMILRRRIVSYGCHFYVPCSLDMRELSLLCMGHSRGTS